MCVCVCVCVWGGGLFEVVQDNIIVNVKENKKKIR